MFCHARPVLIICPESHSQVNCFRSTSSEVALRYKPVPLDTALPALRPQTDVMLTLVLDFLCQEQPILCESIVM